MSWPDVGTMRLRLKNLFYSTSLSHHLTSLHPVIFSRKSKSSNKYLFGAGSWSVKKISLLEGWNVCEACWLKFRSEHETALIIEWWKESWCSSTQHLKTKQQYCTGTGKYCVSCSFIKAMKGRENWNSPCIKQSKFKKKLNISWTN